VINGLRLLRLLVSLGAALPLYCGVQASADFAKHILIDPCALAIWTGHRCQARFTFFCCGSGLKPGAAIRTVNLIGMPVTQAFDDRAQAHENRFAQRFMVDRRCVLQARPKLVARLVPEPQRPRHLHTNCAVRLPYQGSGFGRALRSLRLRQPLVGSHLETSQVTEISRRQAMLNGTFDQ
jgi:hypothetical protein